MLLKPLRMSGRAGNGGHDGAIVTRKGFIRQTDTPVPSRPRARGWTTVFVTIYELSRGLHREASWRAERLGPIRISPLQ